MKADDARCFAVLGYPIGHSKSPAMHNAAFAELGLPHRYHAFAVAPEQLGAALAGARALGLGGLNLTVPHKQAALAHVDVLSPEVRRIGAANTIVLEAGRLTAHSTDGAGFLAGLAELGVSPPRRAVVLGGGGAARCIVDALVHAYPGVAVAWVSRDPSTLPAEAGAERHPYEAVATWLADADLLVNATTVGMAGGPERFPVELPFDRMARTGAVVDIVYRDRPTALLEAAARHGLAIQNGLPMLLWQGVRAQELWRGEPLPAEAVAAMRRALVGTSA